ncbi:MAG: hypothetical protein AAGG02_04840 [Cyanobacteria bacterium P01_H01_bin.15]
MPNSRAFWHAAALLRRYRLLYKGGGCYEYLEYLNNQLSKNCGEFLGFWLQAELAKTLWLIGHRDKREAQPHIDFD